MAGDEEEMDWRREQAGEQVRGKPAFSSDGRIVHPPMTLPLSAPSHTSDAPRARSLRIFFPPFAALLAQSTSCPSRLSLAAVVWLESSTSSLLLASPLFRSLLPSLLRSVPSRASHTVCRFDLLKRCARSRPAALHRYRDRLPAASWPCSAPATLIRQQRRGR